MCDEISDLTRPQLPTARTSLSDYLFAAEALLEDGTTSRRTWSWAGVLDASLCVPVPEAVGPLICSDDNEYADVRVRVFATRRHSLKTAKIYDVFVEDWHANVAYFSWNPMFGALRPGCVAAFFSSLDLHTIITAPMLRIYFHDKFPFSFELEFVLDNADEPQPLSADQFAALLETCVDLA